MNPAWKDVKKFVEDHPFTPIPEGVTLVKVAGVSFVEDYPTNLHRLAIVHTHRKADILVSLVRNPDNPYDSNAVEVRHTGYMLGHLPKDVAAKVAPRLDAGVEIRATIFGVRISPDNPNNPGLDILLEEI